MLLTISTQHEPATELGYLLHKHPARVQRFDLSFGQAHVFYPEAGVERCTACLLLDVDPVGLVRGKGDWRGGMLDQYVNDRPYVASSLMSVAIAQVFGSALAGRSKERAELVATPIPLTARLDALPVRGGEEWLHRGLRKILILERTQFIRFSFRRDDRFVPEGRAIIARRLHTKNPPSP